MPRPVDCRYTFNGDTNRLYLHVFSWPFKHIHCENLAEKVSYAQLLSDASEVTCKEHDDGSLTLELPVVQPPVEVPVIELFLR